MIPQYLSVEEHIRGNHFEQIENPEFLKWEAWEEKYSDDWVIENSDKVMEYLCANETKENLKLFLDLQLTDNLAERDIIEGKIDAMLIRNMQGIYLEYVA